MKYYMGELEENDLEEDVEEEDDEDLEDEDEDDDDDDDDELGDRNHHPSSTGDSSASISTSKPTVSNGSMVMNQ